MFERQLDLVSGACRADDGCAERLCPLAGDEADAAGCGMTATFSGENVCTGVPSSRDIVERSGGAVVVLELRERPRLMA